MVFSIMAHVCVLSMDFINLVILVLFGAYCNTSAVQEKGECSLGVGEGVGRVS